MFNKIFRHMPKFLKRRNVEINVALLFCLLTTTTIVLRLKYEPVGTSLAEKAEEMYERTVHMREACGHIPPQRHLKVFITGRREFYVSERFSLSYCVVPGTASTYWAQFFMALAGINPQFHDYDDAKSTFDLPKGDVHNVIRQHTGLVADLEDKRVKLTTSFLAARNPYSRLFSVYIDQIFLPLKWKVVSKMMMPGDPKREECGSDMSFDEFLSHISDTMLKKKKADISWAPMFSVCLPCETDIRMVVKQESLDVDVAFMLTYIGAEESLREQAHNATFRNINQAKIKHFVEENVENGHSVNIGCISEVELAKRIWTALQIKGYINDAVIFPEEKFKSIFRDDLKDILTDAVLEGVKVSQMTLEDAEQQRRRWKLTFWRQVSKTTMINVQAAYYEDFMLFQYDIDPNKM